MMSQTDLDAEPETFADVECAAETPLAIFVRVPRVARVPIFVWVPKSVVHDDSEVYDAKDNARGKLVIKHWWAAREGLA